MPARPRPDDVVLDVDSKYAVSRTHQRGDDVIVQHLPPMPPLLRPLHRAQRPAQPLHRPAQFHRFSTRY
jgi:hypothetical protein